MDRLRVSSLFWAVGAFFTLIGTLLLVTPQLFTGSDQTIVFYEPVKLGFAFLLAGFLILSLGVVTPPSWLAAVTYIVSALLLGALAFETGRAQVWIETTLLGAVALACLIAAFSPQIWQRRRTSSHQDLLALLLGISEIAAGGLILFYLLQNQPVLHLLNTTAIAFAVLWVVSGIWLVAVQIAGIRKNINVLSSRKTYIWSSYLISAGLFLSFAGVGFLPAQQWVAAVLSITCGLVLAAMPLYAHLSSEKYSPRSLRIRLALVMAGMTCLPLVTIAAVSGLLIEENTAMQAQNQLEAQAASLSGMISEINQMHKAALLASAQSDLLQMDSTIRTQQLAQLAAAYPDISAIVLYNADGTPLASSKGVAIPVTGTPVYQMILASAKETQNVYYSPELKSTVLTYAAPMLNLKGQVSGLLTLDLPADKIAQDLNTVGENIRGRVYLVSGQGQVILHPDHQLVETRAFLPTNPAVNALRTRQKITGSLEYRQNGQEKFAAYAAVPGTDWGVVVEQPAEVALQGVYQGRVLALGLIGFAIIAAMVSGGMIGGWVTSPLQTLSGAVRDLADGNGNTPLPRTRFTEGQALIDTFGSTRQQITARMTNRETALDVLRIARKVLEQQVSEKSFALETANKQVVQMFDQLNLLQQDRSRIEKSLKESEQRFRVLGEVFSYGIWLSDAKGRLLFTSQSYLNLLNMTLEESRLFGWTRRLYSEDVIPVMKRWMECIRTGEQIHCEYRVVGPDAKLRFLSTFGKPVRDDSGNILYWTGVHVDVTDRKEMEQQLQQAQEHFRVAISHSPISIYTNDCDLVYTWIYSGASRPAPVEEWIGKRDEDIYPDWDVSDLVNLKQSVIRTQKAVRQEVHLRSSDHRLTYDITIEPFFDVSGQMKGMTVASIDVTERKRMEEDLEHNLIQIELQHRVNDQHEIERIKFARDLHDGPLQDMIATTFQLQQIIFQTQDQDTKERLQGMQNSLQQQVRNLRTLSFAMRPPILSRFGLAKAIQSYIENFTTRYPDIHLTSELMEDGQLLPERVRAALFRIAQEALTNTARHSQAKEAHLCLRFEGGLAILEVKDNGVGFAPPKDFLVLARNGHLGLAGIRERVEALGGKMELHSKPGEGTRLLVTVPFILERGAIN